MKYKLIGLIIVISILLTCYLFYKTWHDLYRLEQYQEEISKRQKELQDEVEKKAIDRLLDIKQKDEEGKG